MFLRTERYSQVPHPAMLGKGVKQNLLQLFPGHPVVKVGYLDVCTIREGLRLRVRTWATRGNTQRR